MTAREREHAGERERDAERERQASAPDVADGRQREQAGAGADGPARAVLAQHERFEQDDRRERRRGRERAHPHQPRQRREQQAIAGKVVAGVPVLVEDGEADMFVERDAVGLRGHVGRVRIEREPHGQQERAERDRQRKAGGRFGRSPMRYPTGPRPPFV